MNAGDAAPFAALDEADARHRRQAERLATRVAAITARLGQLRAVKDSNALLTRVCADAAETCGFARTMVSQVDDDRWLPWMAHLPPGAALDEEFAANLRGLEFSFETGTPEAVALHERRPVTSHEGVQASRLPALLAEFTSSYVVVPMIASGRVIGLIHGDQGPHGPIPDEVDRDALRVFGEGFALIYERAVLAGRMQNLRDRLREAFAVAEALSAAIISEEMILMPGTTPGPAASVGAALIPPDIAERLSPREREVADLMAHGLANAAIADRLVVSPNTVKTHVRSVIRKLGAINRSDAVARYLGHKPAG
ncbi:MAG: LuxR C-terminal-related transcriptional regulator [Sporichthyaceae bacterium]